MEMVGPPKCISMILCESIHRDERTKNLILVGTFNRITGKSLPIPLPKFCVLFTLTDGQGEFDLSLSIENADSGQPLVEMKGPMTLSDPLSISDFDVEFKGLVFAEEGKYWLVLKANDEILNQRPFEVKIVEESS